MNSFFSFVLFAYVFVFLGLLNNQKLLPNNPNRGILLDQACLIQRKKTSICQQALYICVICSPVTCIKSVTIRISRPSKS